MKFKPGEKIICVSSASSDTDWADRIDKGTIYEVIKIQPDNYYKSKYKVYIEENREGWDILFFESAEKLIHDKEFNDKLNNLIE
jgi:hypothetical protein